MGPKYRGPGGGGECSRGINKVNVGAHPEVHPVGRESPHPPRGFMQRPRRETLSKVLCWQTRATCFCGPARKCWCRWPVNKGSSLPTMSRRGIQQEGLLSGALTSASSYRCLRRAALCKRGACFHKDTHGRVTHSHLGPPVPDCVGICKWPPPPPSFLP